MSFLGTFLIFFSISFKFVIHVFIVSMLHYSIFIANFFIYSFTCCISLILALSFSFLYYLIILSFPFLFLYYDTPCFYISSISYKIWHTSLLLWRSALYIYYCWYSFLPILIGILMKIILLSSRISSLLIYNIL